MLEHKGTKELITKRLKLRRFILSDATSMYKNYANDERVTKFLSWKSYKCFEDVEDYLSDLIRQYDNLNVYHWAIEMDNDIIGSISTIAINDKNCNCEVGYCLGYDYWNKGITTEALNAVMSFLFSEVGIYRIMAKHDVENPSSGKVLQKCNMTYEGRLRDYYQRHDGTYSDSLVYSILRNEFVIKETTKEIKSWYTANF